MSRCVPRRAFTVVALVGAAVLGMGPGAWAGPGTWTSLAAVPTAVPGGAGVEGMLVGAIGNLNLIVAAYGFDPGAGNTKTTRIYNTVTNVWTTGAPGPAPRRAEGTAVVNNGKLYVLGGRSRTVLGSFDRYDPVANTWEALRSMPTARAGLGAAVVGGGIYAIGGRQGGKGPCSNTSVALTTVERYDISSHVWSTVASLPSARSDLAAIAVGGKIYVFGGCRVSPPGSEEYLSDVDVYDPGSHVWSALPPLDQPRAALYQVAALGHKIYIMGGFAGGDALSLNTVFNTATNSYSSKAPMLTPRAEMGVVSAGGSVYTVGGGLPAFGK